MRLQQIMQQDAGKDGGAEPVVVQERLEAALAVALLSNCRGSLFLSNTRSQLQQLSLDRLGTDG